MKYLRTIIFLLAVLVISACEIEKVEVEWDNETVPNSELEKSNNTAVAEEFIISPEGIGNAKLGMSLGKLKQISDRNTEFKNEPNFMVDINAIAVSKSGVTQYYILYLAGTTSHPDRITILMTDNPNYQTQEGVKVGTSIKEAEAIYGQATLSYNTASESREYVTFADRPDSRIKYRTNWLNVGFAGIYPPTSEEYRQTQEFKDTAIIRAIEVSCAPINCPKP